MKAEDRKMWQEVFRNTSLSLMLTTAIAAGVVWAMAFFFHVAIKIGSATVLLGLIGATIAFIGNGLVADATTRWGASKLPQWAWGNRLQAVGFALTIAALLID